MRKTLSHNSFTSSHTRSLAPSGRRLLPFAFYLLLSLSPLAPVAAQETPDAQWPCRREIENGDFAKAAQKLGKKLGKDSLDIPANYAVHRLLSADGCPDRDLERAYRHLTVAHRAYCHAAPRMLDRLTRDGFDGALFSAAFQRLGILALLEARGAATADVYSNLLATYTELPDSIRALALYSRDSIELATARVSGRTDDFITFLQRRPDSPLKAAAITSRDSAAFAEAQSIHTCEGYERFLRQYPQSAESGRAKDSLYTIAFRQAEEADGEQFYRSYADRYPQSPFAAISIYRADSIQYYATTDPDDWRSFVRYLDEKGGWAELALQTLARIALKDKAVEALEQALAHYPLPNGRIPVDDSLYLSLATQLRMAYLIPTVANFSRLYDAHGNHLPEEWRRHDSLAVAAYNNYNYHIIDSCIRAIAPYHEAFIMLQQLIDNDLRYGRSQEALATVGCYSYAFSGSDEYAKLVATLTDAVSRQSAAAPVVISAAMGCDCSYPVPSPDGKRLYFAAKGHRENIGGGDIFSAGLAKGGRQLVHPAIEIDLSHTYGNDAPLSLSADGKLMLTLQSGRYFISRRDSVTGKWLPAEALLPDFGRPIADACLTADGRGVILSVPGRENYQTDTSLNLYLLLFDKGNELIDLGAAVNTPFAERAPYLHSDMRTLYFSSEGHGSLGQMDLYCVTRLSDDRWDLWSEPRNLGVGINTVDNETWLRLSADGAKGFSHRRGRQMEIVTFEIR